MSYVCKLDSDGWQLYSDEPGSTASADAARIMSELLTELVANAKAQLKVTPALSERKLAINIRDAMYDLMDKFDNEGARDSEPEGVLVAELERAFDLDQYSLER